MKLQGKELREYLTKNYSLNLKPNDTLYTDLRHVSRSGMSRDIAVYFIQDNKPRNISRIVAEVNGQRLNKDRDAVKVGGAGMDMGFSIVYNFSASLFNDGHHCAGDWAEPRCPSNDHSNGMEYAHDVLEAIDVIHSDGGYAIRQAWM